MLSNCSKVSTIPTRLGDVHGPYRRENLFWRLGGFAPQSCVNSSCNFSRFRRERYWMGLSIARSSVHCTVCLEASGSDRAFHLFPLDLCILYLQTDSLESDTIAYRRGHQKTSGWLLKPKLLRQRQGDLFRYLSTTRLT